MDTFTLTAGDASASVTLPPATEAPFDQDDLSKQRTDTSFKFELALHGDAPVSVEALAKKTRSDTNFKFERRATPPYPDSDAGSDRTSSGAHESVDISLPLGEAPAMAGRKRQDTNFSFEVTTRDDSAGSATDSAEALGGRTRKDTSFKFEIVVSDPGATEALGSPKRKSASFDFERAMTPDAGGFTITEMQESLGGSGLPDETPDEAKKPRHDTSFSVAVVTPGGGFASIVVRSSESAGIDE